ncbi:MAG: amidohydrolase family protein, partial [Firmicutes bacterium]|nr:amidohydrolase family protein [Bacillota bacterium]
MPALYLRRDPEDGDGLRLARDELVHAHHDLLLALQLLLVVVGGVRDLPLGEARLHRGQHPAQLVDPADLPRFGRAGIVASVQPAHLVTDAEPALAAWGDRARRVGYPWRSLAVGGALLAFGSDAPVESLDPWPGVEVAVTRRDPERASDVLLGEAEGLDLEAAIRAAAIGGP